MNITERVKKIVQEIHSLTNACLPNFTSKIVYLTIFAQDKNDYNRLIDEFSKLGEKRKANNGVEFKLYNPFLAEAELIQEVRVRKPDVHRKELGCADIEVKGLSYDVLREIALEKGYDIIVRKTFEMIELSSFEIDAYAYIVKYFKTL